MPGGRGPRQARVDLVKVFHLGVGESQGYLYFFLFSIIPLYIPIYLRTFKNLVYFFSFYCWENKTKNYRFYKTMAILLMWYYNEGNIIFMNVYFFFHKEWCSGKICNIHSEAVWSRRNSFICFNQKKKFWHIWLEWFSYAGKCMTV